MSRGSKLRRDLRKQKADRETRRREASGPRFGGSAVAPADGALRMNVPTERLGAPGIPQELHLVRGPAPGVPATPEQDRAALSDSSERDFTVVVHLGKEPGSFSSTSLDVSLDPAHGASLIAAPPGIELGFETTTVGKIETVANAKGEVAALKYRCRASSRKMVLTIYSDEVAPLLDHIAFSLDVPLFVRSITWFDEKNSVLSASFVPPFKTVAPHGEGFFDLELRPLYSLYREAITSGSVFYQFLCYAKILEGVFRWYLPKLREDAKQRGMPSPYLRTRVEPHEELGAENQKWVGCGVEKVFNDYLQGQFRDAIAHFALESGEPLVTSSYLASGAVANNLLLARNCARMATTELGLLVRNMKTATQSSESRER